MTPPEKRIATAAEFERHLIDFINGTLLRGAATVDRDTRLFEDGYMNSLRILDLIAMVEKTLGRRVPDRAVRLANFRTIATIVGAFHPDATTAPTPSSGDTASVTPERPFERRGDRSRFASPIDALVARGDVRVTGAGQVALAGLALGVLHAIDHTVASWARALGAPDRRYPSLIANAVLERAGRVENITYVMPTTPSPGAAIERTTALAPAVCYHAYPEWEGKTLAEPVLLTAVGRCYRHEDGNYIPLERLWDFTMREIIILGTRERVEAQRQSLIGQVGTLVTTLELDAVIETATDPFFTAGDASDASDEGRRLMQQAGALKHELRLAVDASGRSVAAASFNHHHDYFGTRFGFSLTNGEAAHSGCVAFGLERWVLAVMAQHGVDDREWPSSVRAWVAAGRAQDAGAVPAIDGAGA